MLPQLSLKAFCLVFLTNLMLSNGIYTTNPCCSTFAHLSATFGPAFDGNQGVEGPLIYPSSDDPYLCNSNTTSNYNNSIVLVPRGNCLLVTKALSAQAGGAIGVIVYQNSADIGMTTLIRMTASDARISNQVQIPSVFISFASFLEITKLVPRNGSEWIVLSINGTGSYDSSIYNVGPGLMGSTVIIIKLLVFVWVIVTIMFLFRFYEKQKEWRRRTYFIRTLPTRVYHMIPEEAPTRVTEVNLDDSKNGEHRRAVTVPCSHAIELTSVVHQVEKGANADHHSITDIELSASTAKSNLESSQCQNTFVQSSSCVICISDFVDKEKLVELPCRHGYHKKCIEPWLKTKSALCPTCKQSILPSGDSRSLEEIFRNEDSAPPGCLPLSYGRHHSVMLILFATLVALGVASSLVYLLLDK